MNFFDFQTAAERYQKGRPYFHPLIMGRIRELLSPPESFHRALDVGCGTGLSTVALTELAEHVCGVDAALPMLAQARHDARISYAAARAEQLPFGRDRFELMTLSQVCHWLDREPFFAEAARVLKPSRWLFIYDAYFSGMMVGNEDFYTWYRSQYRERYPAPPRSRMTFDGEHDPSPHFTLRHHERHQHEITFTHQRLVDYLLTQSNIIAAVECGDEQPEEARLWLHEQMEPFYEGHHQASFIFNLVLWGLQSQRVDT